MNGKIILRPKEDDTSTFSIRVKNDLLDKYNELSNKSGYSRNELINLAMQHYIEIVEFVPNDSDSTNVSTIEEDKKSTKKRKIPLKEKKKPDA